MWSETPDCKAPKKLTRINPWVSFGLEDTPLSVVETTKAVNETKHNDSHPNKSSETVWTFYWISLILRVNKFTSFSLHLRLSVFPFPPRIEGKEIYRIDGQALDREILKVGEDNRGANLSFVRSFENVGWERTKNVELTLIEPSVFCICPDVNPFTPKLKKYILSTN